MKFKFVTSILPFAFIFIVQASLASSSAKGKADTLISHHHQQATSNQKLKSTIEKFSPKRQGQIRSFYYLATGFWEYWSSSWNEIEKNSLKEAKKIITRASNAIPYREQGGFAVSHLFTTTFVTDEEDDFVSSAQTVNFLLDYANSSFSDSNFFAYILGYIKDVDELKDAQGQTVLMKFAAKRGFGIEGEDQVAVKCFSLLLNRGAKINLQDNDEHDALTIALLAHNVPVVKLMQSHLEKHGDLSLNERTKILLKVYKGEPVDIASSKWSDFEKDIYRVANQSQNYKVVDVLYHRFLKETYEKFLEELKPAYYFHQPIWAYNISQIKAYVVDIANTLRNNVIDKKKLKKRENSNLYEYFDGHETIILVKKRVCVVGRILGRNHLEGVIKKLNVEDKVAVPRKFLTIPSGNYKDVKAKIRMPHANSMEESLNLHGTGLNPIGIEFEGAVLYAEYIEEVRTPPEDLIRNYDVRGVGITSGFLDYGGGANLIKSKDGTSSVRK